MLRTIWLACNWWGGGHHMGRWRLSREWWWRGRVWRWVSWWAVRTWRWTGTRAADHGRVRWRHRDLNAVDYAMTLSDLLCILLLRRHVFIIIFIMLEHHTYAIARTRSPIVRHCGLWFVAKYYIPQYIPDHPIYLGLSVDWFASIPVNTLKHTESGTLASRAYSAVWSAQSSCWSVSNAPSLNNIIIQLALSLPL